MSQTLCNVLIHCVFHAKPSAPHIQAEDRKRLNAYALEVCQKLQCPGLIANGPGDHLHLLISLSTAIALSTVIKEVKRNTSVFLKTLNPHRYTDFYWQRGYGAFSETLCINTLPTKKNIIFTPHQGPNLRHSCTTHKSADTCRVFIGSLNELFITKQSNAYSVELDCNCLGTVVRFAPNSALSIAHLLRG